MTEPPRTHVFPPPMERHYPVHQGRIQTRSLEAHIVDHCNLTCAQCCSLSPLLPEWMAATDEVASDLAVAAKVLSPRIFKLVGGEPLLHPDIVDILRCVRDAQIAPVISVTTNGLLLGTMSDAFWQATDALTISRYPKPGLKSDLVQHIEAQAARFAVKLNWKVQDQFTRMTREPTPDNAAATQAIYHDCWIRERCHLIRGGMFYTCTRPAHFHTLYEGRRDFQSDGLALHDGREMRDELLGYLQRETPLQACFHCQGGNAPLVPHRMLKRSEVIALKAAL